MGPLSSQRVGSRAGFAHICRKGALDGCFSPADRSCLGKRVRHIAPSMRNLGPQEWYILEQQFQGKRRLSFRLAWRIAVYYCSAYFAISLRLRRSANDWPQVQDQIYPSLAKPAAHTTEERGAIDPASNVNLAPLLLRRAHGRLGIGDNRCRNRPVRLKSWPPGFLGRTVQSIALGGAHSVLLAHRGVNTTLANPWGTESVAYAWGYGFCGQLGLGEQVGEIQTPRKVAFDK